MDLPPDKARVLRSYDDDRKWDIICDQVSDFWTISLNFCFDIISGRVSEFGYKVLLLICEWLVNICNFIEINSTLHSLMTKDIVQNRLSGYLSIPCLDNIINMSIIYMNIYAVYMNIDIIHITYEFL